MAKKRALVDAVLTATAASDIFTQDLEDISANLAASMPPVAVAVPVTAVASPVLAAAPAMAQQSANSAATAVMEVETQPLTTIILEDDDDELPTQKDSSYLDTRIHFGKNRGLTLSELTPQQIHWYEIEWMAKKEVNGATSVEDLALMNALKAYRQAGGSAGKGRAGADKQPRRQAVDRREASID